MSDPFIRSQSNRQNLGSTRFPGGKAAADAGSPSGTQVAEAYLRSSGPTGSREKLNNFLSKLETTWLLFNKSSEDSGEGELPESQLAFLEDGDTPTPETLKKLRAKFKQSAQKPQKGSQYLFRRSGVEGKKGPQGRPAQGEGPKESPMSDRNTPKPPAQGSKSPSPQGKTEGSSKPEAKQKSSQPQAKENSQKPPRPRLQRPRQALKFEPPKVRQQVPPKSSAKSTAGQKGVLGRKPGSTAGSSQKTPSAPPQPKAGAEQSQMSKKPSSGMLGQRRPQLNQAPRRAPAGRPTAKSFLGSSAQQGAQLRSSDAAGRPGRATLTSPARQAVYSQSLAQVSPGLKKRQVSSQMPVHNSFLDEVHEEGQQDSGPIRLTWSKGKAGRKSPAQRLFAHRQRLQLSRRGSGGRFLGNAISLKSGQAALSSARTDVSTRVAGAAIGSLLEDLYEEEDVENLDEETAVTSLGLILRLGGEFTYKHSTRVLDLALELADEVGVRDKQTRKEIKFGTMLRDVGEFDLLLQGETNSDERLKEFSGFLAGQDMLRAGLLHDIGKVKIPPEILYKPGKLTPEEYEIMKMHPIYGEEIVRPIASLRYLCPTIRGHHERWDGKGYPDGLSGEDIPLAARIISVADVFDALAAERPYKRGMKVEKVKGILEEGRGSHFDPFLVDSFLDVLRRRYP